MGGYEICRIGLKETYDESIPRDKALENLARRIEGYGQLRKKHPDLWVPKPV